jgi:carboxylesterase
MNPHLQNPHLDGAPFFFPGGQVGALLIHGYTATAVEMRLLGEYLAARGLTVCGVLLPGHGATPEEMNRCRWQDWAAHVERAYAELSARCRVVFVGGESMGGLLALYLGARHPEIAGLMSYAAALVVKNKLSALAPLLQCAIKQMPKKRSGSHVSSVVDQRWQGYALDLPPAVAQLLALQRQVRRDLSRVHQPILIFQGRLDGTIAPIAAQIIYDRVASVGKEMIWLDRSTHCVLLDVQWEDAAERSWRFVQRISGIN